MLIVLNGNGSQSSIIKSSDKNKHFYKLIDSKLTQSAVSQYENVIKNIPYTVDISKQMWASAEMVMMNHWARYVLGHWKNIIV